MRVILTTEALQDLDAIFLHILNDHPDAPEIAVRMRNKLQNEIAGLEAFCLYKPGRLSGTRELVVRPYVIPYIVTRDIVLVLRILHGKQKYP